ncbi:MAG TPA: hypothetical protein ENI92_00805 [Bacteroidetes bacterium]|nr:hypothetical protein [Bacteroidota bacterium]
MSYFHQIHFNTLDEKGRIVIPAAFRRDAPPEILASDFWISPDREGFLTVRPDPVWKRYVAFVESLSLDVRTKRSYLRGLHATVQRTSIDRQNRLVLAPQMRKVLTGERNNDKEEVVIVGSGTYFELWPRDRFEGEDTILDTLSKLRDQVEGIVGEGFSG